MQFDRFEIGEVFQTKAARYVKISDDEGMVIMEGMFPLCHKNKFQPQDMVVPLYTRAEDRVNAKR